ncbi:hypothetical protein EV183_003332 [Coemansia sp. RSA 2336]|nr:hypothetical protein EV183_003332 [Coemansia sp. RSA 2336]
MFGRLIYNVRRVPVVHSRGFAGPKHTGVRYASNIALAHTAARISVKHPASSIPCKSPPHRMQARTMFIQTATTPNEDALRFIPGVPVLGNAEETLRTVEFTSPREGLGSPLATRLFAIEGVRGVMFGNDFVTVRKEPDYPWQLMKPDIYAAIMDHFSSGRPLLRQEEKSEAASEDDSEIVAEIKELLESRVRPAIQEDGGDLDFVSFDEGSGVVKIRLRGACRGCASSTVTLKHGVEGMLSYYIPEVSGVEDVGDELEAQARKEFNKLEAELEAKP